MFDKLSYDFIKRPIDAHINIKEVVDTHYFIP